MKIVSEPVISQKSPRIYGLNQLLPVALIQASMRFDVSRCVSYCPNEKEFPVIWPGINVLYVTCKESSKFSVRSAYVIF